jgi:hypothetical protein
MTMSILPIYQNSQYYQNYQTFVQMEFDRVKKEI